MIKRLLSIITSVSLIASALAAGTYAAPAIAGTDESSMEYIPIPDTVISEEASDEGANLMSGGPALVEVSDSSVETNTEFSKPEYIEGASLFSELAGEGTEESPYLIGSAEDLLLFAGNVNQGTGAKAHYKLTADIDLGGREWIPVGYVESSSNFTTSFGGVFDGDGHTVSNFKITDAENSTAYVGFFGHMCAGTVENLSLDSVTIELDSDSTQKLYIGIIAGRVITVDAGTSATITNCSVTNSSIKATSKGTIYAGALSGTAIAGEDESGNSNVFLAFIDAECDIDIASYAETNYINPQTGRSERHVVTAGGLVGYLSAETGSTLTIINSSANGDILASAENSLRTQSMTGGAFGNVKTAQDNGPGGMLTINSCSAQGTVTAISNYYAYVTGGFAGQIYATKNLYINDCYSSADASGKFIQTGYGDGGNDPTAGGFAGQIFFPSYSSSHGKTIKRCFGNGDAIDLSEWTPTIKPNGEPEDFSYVGGFTGFSQAGVFENCYRFESQTVTGSDIIDYPDIVCLSESDAKLLDKYAGFDFTHTWDMNPEAEYFYPTLREKVGYVNFVSDGIIFATGSFGTDGRVLEPDREPAKAPTVDKTYTFNYWSTSEDGGVFNFGGDTLSENTTLYAVFKSTIRQYKLTFMNEGSTHNTVTLNYGSDATLPAITPEKADTEQYYYVFLHWSDTENGAAFDFSEYTVGGNKTFYAVYNEIDKSAWTGGVADKFESGFGTQSLPYLIKTSDEFALFAKVINEQAAGYTDAYYALDANINLGGNIWQPIGNTFNAPFSAHFDGNGFNISNYTVANSQFTGLFGYVLNGTIKDVSLSDFTINFDSTLNKSKYVSEKDSNGLTFYAAYIGGLAGRVDAKRGVSEISGVRVSNANINIDADFAKSYIYTGNILGYGVSYTVGDLLVHDCFATNDITSVNKTGYSYVGGIAGRFDLGSLGNSLMSSCYYTGSISSTSYNSSYAGGIVGYLFSFGSGFIGGTSSDNEDASLSAEDLDILVEGCFAVAHLYSNSSKYRSLAGPVVGAKNSVATVKNTYYPDTLVFVEPEPEEAIGTEVSLAQSILNQEFLQDKCGFDFENVWTYISGYRYPVLISMVADKEMFKVTSSSFTDGTLNASIQVFSNTKPYSLVFCVYNARNQIIGMFREDYSDAAEIRVSLENMDKASYYSVSVIDKISLAPLFDGIKVEL